MTCVEARYKFRHENVWSEGFLTNPMEKDNLNKRRLGLRNKTAVA